MRFLDGRLLGLARGHSRRLWLTVGLGAAAGAATVVQAALLAGVVDAVFLGEAGLPAVAWLLVLLGWAILARALLTGGERFAANDLAACVVEALRKDALLRLAALGPVAVGRRRTGEVQTVLVDGLDELHAFFADHLPQLAISAVVPLGIAAVVLSRDLLSTAVLVVTAPLIPTFMVLIGSLAQNKAERRMKSLGQVGAAFLDMVQGLATLKILGRAREMQDRIRRLSAELRGSTMAVMRLAMMSALALELLATLSTAVVAVEIGLRLLYGRVDFVDAFFVLLLAPEFYLPLRLLGQRFHAGRGGVAAMDRLAELLGERGVAPASSAVSCEVGDQAVATMPAPPRLELVDVSVDHVVGSGRTRPALRGVSFTIESGEHIALVGPSGAGKTTILQLLLRFLEPDEGELHADGFRADEIPVEQWRQRLAWVPQQPTIFAGTVEENLRLANRDAGVETLRLSARQAGAESFIEALPEGWSTHLGEAGARLSVGQAQRLAIARALLRNAEVVLLDEPGAGLDPLSLEALDTATAELVEGRSAVIVAHRLETIRRADRVLVLDDGRLVESGTPDELARAGGVFARFLGEHGTAS